MLDFKLHGSVPAGTRMENTAQYPRGSVTMFVVAMLTKHVVAPGELVSIQRVSVNGRFSSTESNTVSKMAGLLGQFFGK